jgi:tRNA threonylcarbamoyladenosine biosynthesis protein TsaE
VSAERSIEIRSTSPERTQRIGERIGEQLLVGAVVLLHGDLGAGKTTLTQGIARGLGVTGYVQSPTFTLVSEHEGSGLKLYHLDLYRLSDESELESFGYDQYLAPSDGVSVIEWPERAGTWLPDSYMLVELTHAGDEQRTLRVSTHGFAEWDLETLER